jgi:hypothetical protein
VYSCVLSPRHKSRYEQVVTILHQNAAEVNDLYLETKPENSKISTNYSLQAYRSVFGKNGALITHFSFITFMVSLAISTLYAIHFNHISAQIDDVSLVNKFNIVSHVIIITTFYFVRYTHAGYCENELFSRRSDEEESYYGELLSISAGNDYNVKHFCHICQIYRHPDRKIGHCHQVGKCIEMYDHYCHFLGSPIGKENFMYFMFFLFMMTIASMPLDVYLWIFYRPLNMTWKFIADVYFIWVFVVWLYVSFIFIFYIYIAILGLTTREYLKLRKSTTA